MAGPARSRPRNWVTPEFMCRPRRTGFTGRMASERWLHEIKGPRGAAAGRRPRKQNRAQPTCRMTGGCSGRRDLRQAPCTISHPRRAAPAAQDRRPRLSPSGDTRTAAAVCCRCAARRARPSYDRARNVLASAQSPAILSAPTTIEDAVFPVGPTGKVNVRIVRLAGAKGAMAVNGSAASGRCGGRAGH